MKNLKIARNDVGLTQKQLASKLNISQQCYSDYENGRTSPDIDMLKRIADVLNTSLDFLIGRTDDFGNVPNQFTAPTLTDDEAEILKLYRAMTHSQRIRFAAYGEGMLGSSASKKA